jgi:transcriptional regulator with XRE-family HTH domain
MHDIVEWCRRRNRRENPETLAAQQFSRKTRKPDFFKSGSCGARGGSRTRLENPKVAVPQRFAGYLFYSCCILCDMGFCVIKPRKVEIMQEIQRNIARNLRRAMDGRSAEEFAEDLGISKTAVLQYLRGAANPTVDTLTVLAAGLGITPVELISNLPPGWEQAETILRASKEIAALPLARREAAARLLLELAALFAE